jgi:hypothetical protein
MSEKGVSRAEEKAGSMPAFPNLSPFERLTPLRLEALHAADATSRNAISQLGAMRCHKVCDALRSSS